MRQGGKIGNTLGCRKDGQVFGEQENKFTMREVE